MNGEGWPGTRIGVIKPVRRYPVLMALVMVLMVASGLAINMPMAQAGSCSEESVTVGSSTTGTATFTDAEGVGAFAQITSTSGGLTAGTSSSTETGGTWTATVSINATSATPGQGSVGVKSSAGGDSCTISVTISAPATTTTTTTTTTPPTTTTTRPPTTTAAPTTTTTTTTTTTEPPETTTTTSTTTTTTTTTAAPETTTSTSTTTTAAPVTTTTIVAAVPPPPGDDSFLANNWWWLTIVGLTLIALIATVAILQPQRQGFGGRVAGVATAPSGRHVRTRTSAPRTSKPAPPTMTQRMRRTKVAQTMALRGAQPKPPKPSFFRRIGNWFRDSEVADSMRARSDARKVQTRTTRGKPPKIKRRK